MSKHSKIGTSQYLTTCGIVGCCKIAKDAYISSLPKTICEKGIIIPEIDLQDKFAQFYDEKNIVD